ncbi:hypothetical protein [Zunongwangia sp.]|uniref:hypothetical protein n=1 Tax=Zunongwangia sp. TaxID=1965325 RepID=UPI003AA8D305
MDGLELLKKQWKKQEAELPKLSYEDIYKMIWKRSSSIVKWIFVISILEFVIGSGLSLFVMGQDYWEKVAAIHLTNFTIINHIINIIAVVFFIYKFYSNYRRISTTTDTKRLMNNILKARKSVKYYINYMLIHSGIILVCYSYFSAYYHLQAARINNPKIHEFDTLDWLKFTGIILLVLTVFIVAFWLFYRLIYGILLKRLNKNYKELKNLE